MRSARRGHADLRVRGFDGSGRTARRVTTGLVETGQDPIEYSADKDFNNPDTSNHPVHRTKRVEEQIAAAKAARRSHLRIVPDPEAEQ